jgi:hypothetical protein
VNKNKDFYDFNNYVTELKEINRPEIVTILNNYSVFYFFIKTNIFNLSAKSLVFIFNSQYFSKTFQGIMSNNRTARVFTAEQP